MGFEGGKMISALIPTIGRETLPIVISNLIGAVDEIVILDSGEIPSYSRDEVMIVLEVAKRTGIDIQYHRSEGEGVGKARWKLINFATSENCLFIDDDVFIYKETILEMDTNLPQFSFVIPCCIIAADFLGVKGLVRDAITIKEAEDLVGNKMWMYPYFQYVHGVRNILLPYCGTQAIMFRTFDAKKYCAILDCWKKGANREDIVFTKMLTGNEEKGLLLTNHRCYHMETARQKREWANKDEDIGYQKVISSDYTGYVE
jgi:glycosyltransferase involved in cell wall biosynthesis